MAIILSIIDKFHIKDRGLVYRVKDLTHPNVLRLGDTLQDLQGNYFKVTGMEMIRRQPGTEASANELGILLESLDNTEVQGSFLVDTEASVNFLFCNHPLYARQVDEDYKEEYEACHEYFNCGLFSYEDMELGRLSLYGNPVEGLTIYRGWMMKPEMYALFYEKLKERNIILVNSPEEYSRYHLLPGWYEDFKEDTAKSAWTKGTDVKDALHLLGDFQGSVMVKDYVKSRKHEWYDACFIPQAADTPLAQTIIQNFITRQGESLIGGIVLREFLQLKSAGFHEISGMPISEEYRAFVFCGRLLIVDDYWLEGHEAVFGAGDLQWIEQQLAKITSPFVTMDFARTTDGKLVIMELGDGQVSGLQQIPAQKFYEKWSRFTKNASK